MKFLLGSIAFTFIILNFACTSSPEKISGMPVSPDGSLVGLGPVGLTIRLSPDVLRYGLTEDVLQKAVAQRLSENQIPYTKLPSTNAYLNVTVNTVDIYETEAVHLIEISLSQQVKLQSSGQLGWGETWARGPWHIGHPKKLYVQEHIVEGTLKLVDDFSHAYLKMN